MAAKWRVKDGTQAFYDGKLYGPGDTFSGTDDQLAAEGVSEYVEKVKESKAQESSANKATQPESNKAQASSANKSK